MENIKLNEDVILSKKEEKQEFQTKIWKIKSNIRRKRIKFKNLKLK